MLFQKSISIFLIFFLLCLSFSNAEFVDFANSGISYKYSNSGNDISNNVSVWLSNTPSSYIRINETEHFYYVNFTKHNDISGIRQFNVPNITANGFTYHTVRLWNVSGKEIRNITTTIYNESTGELQNIFYYTHYTINQVSNIIVANESLLPDIFSGGTIEGFVSVVTPNWAVGDYGITFPTDQLNSWYVDPPLSGCGDIVASGTYTLTTNLVSQNRTCIRVNVSDVVIDGAGFSIMDNESLYRLTDNNYAVYSSGFSNITIKNLYVENYTVGIYLSSVTNSTIQNNIINRTGYAYYDVTSGRSNVLENNTILNTTAYGVYVSGGVINATIANNTINKSGFYGIYVYNAVAHTIIQNNTLDYAGIELIGDANHSLIEGNNINNYTRYGVLVYTSDNETIENNTMTNGYAHGVLLQFSLDTTIKNNTAHDNTGYAIAYGFYVYQSSNNIFDSNNATRNSVAGFAAYRTNSVVENNTFKNNIANNHSVAGFYITGNANLTNLTNNTAYDSDYSFYIFSSNNILHSNTAYNASIATYYLTNNPYGNNTMTDNIAYDAGVFINDSGNNTLYNNTIHSVINGITIQGANSNNNNISGNTIYNTTNEGIYLYVASNTTIQQNNISRVAANGINIYLSSDDSKIFNNNISNVTNNGIVVNQCTNANISYNLINDIQQSVMRIYASSSFYIFSNIMNDSDVNGILLLDVSNDGEIRNNTIYNVTTGINLDGLSNGGVYRNNISDNRIENNTYGITVQATLNLTIQNNTIYNNSLYNLYIFGYPDRLTVLQNRITKSTSYQIFQQTGYNSTYQGNTINNSIAEAIRTSGTDTYIKDNLISDNLRGVRSISSENIIISNNTIFNNSQEGIWLASSNAGYIDNNTIYSNRHYGIYFDTANNFSSSNNIIYNNSFYGILGVTSSNNNNFSNNIVYNNSLSGFALSASSNNNRISDLTSYNNSIYNIFILNSQNNNFVGGITENDSVGIFARNSVNITVNQTRFKTLGIIPIDILNSSLNIYEVNITTTTPTQKLINVTNSTNTTTWDGSGYHLLIIDGVSGFGFDGVKTAIFQFFSNDTAVIPVNSCPSGAYSSCWLVTNYHYVLNISNVSGILNISRMIMSYNATNITNNLTLYGSRWSNNWISLNRISLNTTKEYVEFGNVNIAGYYGIVEFLPVIPSPNNGSGGLWAIALFLSMLVYILPMLKWVGRGKQ